jgi:membrane protein YqaA with SNARE-associated domain
MSKHLPSNFLNHWFLIQIFGSIALAITTQAIVTLLTLLTHIDNLVIISLLRLGGCLLSSIIQGYLQWQLLKQVFKSLDRQWIYTTVAALPMTILNWGLIHLGIKLLVLDEDGTVFIILAIVGGVCGGINGYIIGNWQKYLFKERLYWRSLWHDWDREQLLAGVLSGVSTSVIIIGAVFLYGWDWIASPISAFICSICLGSISQVMYGLIVGDTIHDVFKQAKLIE